MPPRRRRIAVEVKEEVDNGAIVSKLSTPSGKAYGTPEILHRILSFLSPHDLTNVMRLEKSCLPVAIKVLYHTIDYNAVPSIMKKTITARERMYCNAIMILNAQKTNLTPAMLGEPRATKGQTSRITTYKPGFTNSVVTHLRQKCRYLQKIIFGRPYKHFDGNGSWVVYCEGKGGRVDIARYVTSSLLKHPPLTIASPPPPSNDYTVRFLLDLELVVNTISDWPSTHRTGVGARRNRVAELPVLELWAEALRTSPAFGSLGRALDAGQVPLS